MSSPEEFKREVARIIGEAAGEVSMCWENIGAAGVFESTHAAAVVDRAVQSVLDLLSAGVSA